jgi:hypothetical protein
MLIGIVKRDITNISPTALIDITMARLDNTKINVQKNFTFIPLIWAYSLSYDTAKMSL